VSADLAPSSSEALAAFIEWYIDAKHTRAEVAAALERLYLEPHAALERDMRRVGLNPCVIFYGLVPTSPSSSSSSSSAAVAALDYHLQERREYDRSDPRRQPAIYWCRDARLGAQIERMRDTLQIQYPALGNVAALVDLVASMVCNAS
jgi:hypothetical protein